MIHLLCSECGNPPEACYCMAHLDRASEKRETMIPETTCPTCGSIVSMDEGTNCYVPMTDRLCVENARLRELLVNIAIAKGVDMDRYGAVLGWKLMDMARTGLAKLDATKGKGE